MVLKGGVCRTIIALSNMSGIAPKIGLDAKIGPFDAKIAGQV